MKEISKFESVTDEEFIQILKTAIIEGNFSVAQFREILRRGEDFLKNEPGVFSFYKQQKTNFDKSVANLQSSVIDSLKLETLYPKLRGYTGGESQPFYLAGSTYDTGKLSRDPNVENNELIVGAALQGILDQILKNTKTAIKKDWFVVSMYLATIGGFLISVLALWGFHF